MAQQVQALNFNNFVNNTLAFLDVPIVSSFLRLALILYASMAAPKLPPSFVEVFDNIAFKLLILFLILWTGNRDPTLSILIAVGFLVTMNALSGRKAFEAFGLGANIHDDDIYYMKNRVKHIEDYREMDRRRANANERVSAIVHENNKRAKEILELDSAENKKLQKLGELNTANAIESEFFAGGIPESVRDEVIY